MEDMQRQIPKLTCKLEDKEQEQTQKSDHGSLTSTIN